MSLAGVHALTESIHLSARHSGPVHKPATEAASLPAAPAPARRPMPRMLAPRLPETHAQLSGLVRPGLRGGKKAQLDKGHGEFNSFRGQNDNPLATGKASRNGWTQPHDESTLAEKRARAIGVPVNPNTRPNFMEKLRIFDAKHPILSPIMALAAIGAFSTLLGTVAGYCVDGLAHLTSRKNDNVGMVVGSLIGILTFVTNGVMLFGVPKRLEVALRWREFRHDAKGPGQSRRLIEKHCLPLYMAMLDNARSNLGVQHDDLLINGNDVRKSLNYSAKWGHGSVEQIRAERSRYLLELTAEEAEKIPSGPDGYARYTAKKDVPHAGIIANRVYVSVYRSANEFLERDFNHSFDVGNSRVAKFLSSQDAKGIWKQAKPKGAAPDNAVATDRRFAHPLTTGVKPGDAKSVANQADGNLSADFAAWYQQFHKANANNIDVASPEGKFGNSHFPIMEPGKNGVSAQLTAVDCVRDVDLGIHLPTPEKLAHSEDLELLKRLYSHSYQMAESPLKPLQYLQLADHNLYTALMSRARLMHPDEVKSYDEKSWVRVDELTKISPILMGLRPATTHTLFRNFFDALSEGFFSAADPQTQSRNAGTSVLMYLPLLGIGSVVTILGLGLSSSTPPPSPAAESAKAAKHHGLFSSHDQTQQGQGPVLSPAVGQPQGVPNQGQDASTQPQGATDQGNYVMPAVMAGSVAPPATEGVVKPLQGAQHVTAANNQAQSQAQPTPTFQMQMPAQPAVQQFPSYMATGGYQAQPFAQPNPWSASAQPIYA